MVTQPWVGPEKSVAYFLETQLNLRSHRPDGSNPPLPPEPPLAEHSLVCRLIAVRGCSLLNTHLSHATSAGERYGHPRGGGKIMIQLQKLHVSVRVKATLKTKVLTLFINREFSKLWGEEIAGPLDAAMKLKDSYSLVEVMTNLDSILKSRDITLPTKVSLVKAMVFPKSCMDVRVGP